MNLSASEMTEHNQKFTYRHLQLCACMCVYVCKKLWLKPKNIDKWLGFDAEVN